MTENNFWGTLQEEMRPWQLRNFPNNRNKLHPLLGIIEECGELMEACKEEDGFDNGLIAPIVEISDAVADIMIFMADYCNQHNLNLAALTTDSENYHNSDLTAADLLVCLGKLCHARLKMDQGIRIEEDHGNNEKLMLCNIINILVNLCDFYAIDFLSIVKDTWDKVKKRDWQKDNRLGMTDIRSGLETNL